MAPVPASAFSRRLLVASVVFVFFVLFDLDLFGWLIFRSLSHFSRLLLDFQHLSISSWTSRVSKRLLIRGGLELCARAALPYTRRDEIAVQEPKHAAESFAG